MSKLVKLVASFIIFLLIFNLNSISYSKSYSDNNDYKLTIKKDIFFVSNENQINLNLNPNLIFENDVTKILLKTTLSTTLTYLFSSMSLIAFAFLAFALRNNFITSDFFIYFFIVIINSFSIFIPVISKDKPYYLTLVASLFGLLSYAIFIVTQIFFESLFIENSRNSLTTEKQSTLFFAFMPLFITSVGTTFYYLITKENSEEMTEEKLSKILEEQSKSIKELSNKVRVSGNSVSFSLVKF